MIHPTATDLLRNIDATLAEKVEPSLGDLGGRSALATVRHLLNFVLTRIEHEGQALLDDILALRPLLTRASEYLRGQSGNAEADRIDAALNAGAAPDPARYRSLDDLAGEAGTLREALYQALAHLQTLRAAQGETAAYKELRATIRGYIVRQIEQEGEIVGSSFFGRGPRR